MKPRRMTTGYDAAEIFARAARERALTVISVQDGDNWKQFKSRFLERDAARRFFVLDHVPDDERPLPSLAAGQCVGVSLRQSSRKFLFSSVVEAKGQFVFDPQTSVPAIRYRWPEQITELQRRVYYRTPVPQDSPPIPVQIWRGGAKARHAAGETPVVLSGAAINLSCGGIQVGVDGGPRVDWPDDELLGVEINLADGRPPIVVDARFRGLRLDDQHAASFAIQFIGLEVGPEGRSALQRLAFCVQRLYRLGASVGQGPASDAQ